MGVKFKLVVGFPGYEVSSDGRLWSKLVRAPIQDSKTGRIQGMKWVERTEKKEVGKCATGWGYLRTILRRDGKRHNKFIHVLVCEAFHGPRPGTCRQWHAAHKNGNPTDNRACNLRWATVRENNYLDQKKHGTWKLGQKK